MRVNWAVDYAGRALVVYGHTPVPEPEWIRNTVNIDTGCVYGGKLSALRYPEMTIVSVKARRAYYRPRRSLPAGVGLRAETRMTPLVARPLSDPRARPLAALCYRTAHAASRARHHAGARPRRDPLRVPQT